MTEAVKRPRRATRCPVCGRPSQPAERPFCSRRCREEDLRRWITGAYRIAGEEFVGENDNEPKT
jgi:uncharacterized protein